MKDEPETVKISKEEKMDVFQNRVHGNYEELQMSEESLEEIPDRKIYNVEDPIKGIKEHVELGTLEETYRTIFENYAIAITIVDNNERIVSWNTYAEELLGMDQNDLFMRPVKTLYPPEEWEKIRTENIRKKGIKYHMETKMIRKKELRPFDVEISLCVLKGEKGNIIGSIGIIKDITKQKEMERAFRKSEEKFKQLYEKAPIPYHTLSPDGRITDVNDTWCQTLGYKKDEIIGKPIFDFVDASERETAKVSFEKKLHSKQPYSLANERTYLTKNGDKRIFIIRDFFSFDEKNNVNAVYTIMDDVTELKKAEGEIKKHEAMQTNIQRLQTIIEKIEDGITLSDTKGNFELFNSKMQEITGYTMEEANRCGDFTTLLYPDLQERKKALDNINETIKKGVSRNIETTIQTKDGTKKTLLVSTSIIKLDNRDMFLSVYHDITERIKMQQILNESTTLYETLINASPEAISVFDMEGRFIYASPQTLKLHGYERKEDLLGHSAFELIAPEDHTSAMNILQQITRTPILHDLQYTALRKDGTRFILEGRAVVIKDQYGNPKSFISVTRDITERKMAEEALRKSEERFRQIAESAGEWIWETDAMGLYTYASPVVEKILGYKLEEIIGKKYFYDFFAPDVKEELKKAAFETFIKKEPIKNLLNANVHRNGNIVLLETNGMPVLDDKGNLLGYRGADTDITERKKAEENLKEKINELERYKTATVGRELKMIELKKQIKELDENKRTGGRNENI